MSQIKIDIVIPSYINDIYCIVPCIDNLSKQTVMPNNIIICISEINKDIANILTNEIKNMNVNTNIIVLDTTEKMNASQNRNRGIMYCKNNTNSDYIMFIDCDDFSHSKKIEYFLYFLNKNNNISLFVHNYSLNDYNFNI